MIPRQQPTRGFMNALSEKHLAIFRRHMVDVIGTGKSELDERVMAVVREVGPPSERQREGTYMGKLRPCPRRGG